MVHKCIECKENVKNTDKMGSVQCSQCDRWSHLKCTSLVPEALKCLWDTYDATGHHWWACEGCNKAYMNLTRRMNQWERDMAELKATVTSNTALAKETSAKVEKMATNMEEVAKSRKEDKADAVNEATKRMSAELLEREGKKNNAILYGLNEPPLTVKGKDRKTRDLDNIEGMFREMGVRPETSNSIKFSFRMGELDDKVTEEPRPLCIGLQNTESRDHIFEKARNLGRSKNYFRVSIVPDLTKLQREEDRALMKQADKLNSEMTEEDKKNWFYRCVGKKGERRIAKLRVRQETRGATGGRREHPNSNHEPLGTRSHRPHPFPENQDSDHDTSLLHGFPTPAEVANQGSKRKSPSLSSGSPGSPRYRHRPNQQSRFSKRGRAEIQQ